MSEKEAKSRIKINKLLEASGWRFFDNENGHANIQLELNVKLTKLIMDDLGDNFDKISNGFVDFLLLDDHSKPLVVLEAKSEEKSPLVGKEQAREYAQSVNVRYVILSNGNQHYFWNIHKGNPQIISTFPTLESLNNNTPIVADVSKLYKEEITEDYIAVVKNSRYHEAPEYRNTDTRKKFMEDNGLNMLRHYQIKALQSLQQAIKEGNDRFLFEMATGTGKTLTSAGVIRLFLRTGNAHRVLFLVDRLELENQALKSFVNYLKLDYQTVIFKKNVQDWRKAEIVVSTVQSLTTNSKYRSLFNPSDFDLLIVDESHRSINGSNRAVFDYFDGYKLGLTATPKDYIKNIDEDKLQSQDPKAWEKRQLLDSYRTFGCESGTPTFRYSLLDGVRDGFLINPTVIDARTDITTKLLAEEGYAVFTQTNDDKEETTDKKDNINQADDEDIYFARDFERKFFSEETNKIFVKTFMDNAKRDPITGEIGKGIVFCVSRRHAAKITQLLNLYADLMFPNKYQSDFAMQITSDVPHAQDYTINFQNNNLSGHSPFLEGYKSSKTRICVTVGMMTTGYDCQDLLNICLFRPVFSPTDFIQIKGRGTRKFTFKTPKKSEKEVTVEKETFKLFDFFGNCEYFEEKFNYDQVLELPKPHTEAMSTHTPPPPISGFENFAPDPIKSFVETVIGAEGMKIDRMFFETFESKVQEDESIKKQAEEGDIQGAILSIEEKMLSGEVTWETLINSIEIDRKITKKEIVEKIFGVIPFFKNKAQLVDEQFKTFADINAVPDDKSKIMQNFFTTYVTDKDLRDAVQRKEFQRLGTDITTYSMAELKQLGKENMLEIVNYVEKNIDMTTYL